MKTDFAHPYRQVVTTITTKQASTLPQNIVLQLRGQGPSSENNHYGPTVDFAMKKNEIKTQYIYVRSLGELPVGDITLDWLNQPGDEYDMWSYGVTFQGTPSDKSPFPMAITLIASASKVVGDDLMNALVLTVGEQEYIIPVTIMVNQAQNWEPEAVTATDTDIVFYDGDTVRLKPADLTDSNRATTVARIIRQQHRWWFPITWPLWLLKLRNLISRNEK